jgi:hypothetical protein
MLGASRGLSSDRALVTHNALATSTGRASCGPIAISNSPLTEVWFNQYGCRRLHCRRASSGEVAERCAMRPSFLTQVLPLHG